MKILVIHGSMRKGNTYELTQALIRRLAANPTVEITEISVCELALPFCVSCHMCFAKGEEYCPHYSLMQKIEAALLDCDGVIVSGTTYMWALNAAMKNLLDHLAFLFHRPALFGKRGMIVTTSAGMGEKSAAKYLKTVLGQWGINGALTLTLTTKERELYTPAKISAKLDRAARRFYRQLCSDRPLSPSLKNISVHNAFRAMSLGEFSSSQRDTAYWRQSGVGDKVYPHKISAFKYLVGAVVYTAARQTAAIAGRLYKKKA